MERSGRKVVCRRALTHTSALFDITCSPQRKSVVVHALHRIGRSAVLRRAVPTQSSSLFLSVAAQFGMAPPWQDVNFLPAPNKGEARIFGGAARILVEKKTARFFGFNELAS